MVYPNNLLLLIEREGERERESWEGGEGGGGSLFMG